MSLQETQNGVKVTVPVHLQQFIVDQHYEEYTPVDQAVWRYVMRQNHNFLGKRAHEAYREGLAATGISIESIPDIEHMDQCLSRFGWGAAIIDGFIPPDAFMDFQAHGILAISADIRTDQHIAYTPAPDIIHESAGHAPMIYNDGYRKFLQIIGSIGAKALSSKEDYEVYEAIRKLSILKEDPNSDPQEVEQAQADLDRKQIEAAAAPPSEATLISRLYWWTVEYGLIGDVNKPQIYGAGLLSSVGESQTCLQDDVNKIPFSVDCIYTSYDITRKQPQLFVCSDFNQLIEVVEEFANTLAQRVGGTKSLEKAIHSENIATYKYSSGLEVSGVISGLEYDGSQEAVYIRTNGPTALSYQNQELPGHDTEYHYHGFSSPVGNLLGSDKALEDFTLEDLIANGIRIGEQVELEFHSGVQVRGVVKEFLHRDGKLLLIAFSDCTVTYGEKVLFQPEWGTYDMAVGSSIVSVYAGAADKRSFLTGTSKPSELKTEKRTYSDREKRRHGLYQQVRDLRTTTLEIEELVAKLQAIYAELANDFPKDWLLRLEMLELLTLQEAAAELQQQLRADLEALSHGDEETTRLITNGLELVSMK